MCRFKKMAAVAAVAVLAAGCKNEYKYTPKGEGVQILKEGPIQLSSAKPEEPAKPEKKEAQKKE